MRCRGVQGVTLNGVGVAYIVLELLFFDFCCVYWCSFYPSIHPSLVWLMFDMASQLLLLGRHTHGQECGMDGNDGGSLENGPGIGLWHCGHRQEASLEDGLRSGASLLTKRKCSKITETVTNYIKEMSEKDKSLAEIGYVVEVQDQSPAHEAQEEISKDGAHVALARDPPEETPCLLRATSPLFVKVWCAILMNKKINVFLLGAAEKDFHRLTCDTHTTASHGHTDTQKGSIVA